MKTIEVAAPGLLTTVQDLGREGFGPIGVSPSGAADAVSLRLGNLLVGNPANAAGLEMTLLGGTFHFTEGGLLALTGSDFGATLDDAPAGLWASVQVRAGQTLRVGPTRSGARCYLCVQGGIAVPPFLGSASTHLLSGLGGFEGRALRKGDVLPIGPSPESAGRTFKRAAISTDALAKLAPRKTLRVTPGPQSDWFPEVAQHLFYENIYRVTEESNRIGIRLTGNPLLWGSDKNMITEGVPLGAIQLPPGGQPIIMFVEQQTTGGYPKIANVISADMHSVGQLRPRDEIRFAQVSQEEAHTLLAEQEQLLASNILVFE
jgi:antagonist of KipI